MNKFLESVRHAPEAASRAIRAACVAVSLSTGKTAEQIAAEVAACAVASVCSKGVTP